MTIANRIKDLRESRNWTQKELAAKIGGIGYTAICNWEKGSNGPNPTQRKKLCEVFGITLDELYGIAPKKDPLPVQRVPLISWVHANKFEDIPDQIPSNEYIYSDIKFKGVFALRVTNDCMSPEFNDGDIIIVCPGIQIDHDSFVVVADRESNTATFKQLKIYGNKKILHPLNPKYKDIELDHKKQYHIVGKVIAKQRRY
jgi:SOS-response transcriptional repressor LexA